MTCIRVGPNALMRSVSSFLNPLLPPVLIVCCCHRIPSRLIFYFHLHSLFSYTIGFLFLLLVLRLPQNPHPTHQQTPLSNRYPAAVKSASQEFGKDGGLGMRERKEGANFDGGGVTTSDKRQGPSPSAKA